MEKQIEGLVNRFRKFQEALNWEIDNRTKGLLTVNLDCENEVQWAKYDSNYNIQGIYFVRIYFEHRIEIRSAEVYDRHNLIVKIVEEEPFTIIIDINIEEKMNLSPNIWDIGGYISVQVINEEKQSILPLILYVENDEFTKKIKKDIKFFQNFKNVEDEGLIWLDEIINKVTFLLEKSNISFDIFN